MRSQKFKIFNIRPVFGNAKELIFIFIVFVAILNKTAILFFIYLKMKATFHVAAILFFYFFNVEILLNANKIKSFGQLEVFLIEF
jgi:hypothetical protein